MVFHNINSILLTVNNSNILQSANYNVHIGRGVHIPGVYENSPIFNHEAFSEQVSFWH